MPYTMHTGVIFTLTDDIDREEHEAKLRLKFRVYPARAATMTEPGEAASVSIQEADIEHGTGLGRQFIPAPPWLWPALESDQRLHAELLAHAADTDEYARDRAADARREEMMMERGR
jgi:hypothetical protein